MSWAQDGRRDMEILEAIAVILGGGATAATAAYLLWYRPLSQRLEALETRVLAALPAAQDEREAILDEVLALVEGSDDPRTALAVQKAGAAQTARRIPPPDPGIEYNKLDTRLAVSLAKQELVLNRGRERLVPHDAALKWPPGTVFLDEFQHVYVVTNAKPVCIYKDGTEVVAVAKIRLPQFGSTVSLLVTVEELRAGHLMTADEAVPDVAKTAVTQANLGRADNGRRQWAKK